VPGGDAIVRREREIRDREAARYDDHRDRDPYQRDVEDAIVLEQADVRPEHIVVDAGCGTGRHLPELLRRSARVIGVDHSSEMLALAREKIAPEERGRLELIQADLRSLPLDDRVADRVLCLQTLQHLPTHEFRLALVRELLRVLKPGGVLVVSTYRWLGHVRRKKEGFFESGIYRYAFTARELGALLREAGFVDERVGGAVVLPSLAERLGAGVRPQARVAFTPAGRHLAHYLVARGVRPSG
jgi:ubiquinone/menaquinone biosynthesis C-methylase UbiE